MKRNSPSKGKSASTDESSQSRRSNNDRGRVAVDDSHVKNPRASEDVRPKERASVAHETEKSTGPTLGPHGTVEEEGSLLSVSLNSLGPLNWNVIQDEDESWKSADVIFALEHGEEAASISGLDTNHHYKQTKSQGLDKKNHCHHHHHHEEETSKFEEETKLKRIEALYAIEESIVANPLNWSSNPEDFEFKKVRWDQYRSSTMEPPSNLPRMSMSAGSVFTVAEGDNYFDQLTPEQPDNASMTWSAPADVGGEDHKIKPSGSIGPTFKQFKKTRGSGDKPAVPPTKSEDVDSIISTAISQKNDTFAKPIRPLMNVRRRIGLAFIGVAMVCGVVGVSFAVYHIDEIAPAPSSEQGEGGGGGRRRGGVPGKRERNKTSSGCQNPFDIISAVLLSSSPTSSSSSRFPAQVDCDSEARPEIGYDVGSTCKFTCGANQRLRGAEIIRCRKYDAGYNNWCRVLSLRVCREMDFSKHSPRCEARRRRRKWRRWRF